jgi:hypothetical protein
MSGRCVSPSRIRVFVDLSAHLLRLLCPNDGKGHSRSRGGAYALRVPGLSKRRESALLSLDQRGLRTVLILSGPVQPGQINLAIACRRIISHMTDQLRIHLPAFTPALALPAGAGAKIQASTSLSSQQLVRGSSWWWVGARGRL